MRASAGSGSERPRLIRVVIAACLLAACGSVRAPGGPASRGPVALIGEEEEIALPLPRPLTGDLDQMLERRQVRILVPYNRTNYFIDKGVQRGTVVDTAQALEQWLNRKYARRATDRISVALFPTSRDLLLPALQQGLGDIAAGSITITPDRKTLVDFSEPVARDIRELVVTGPGAPELRSLDDLGGQEVHVRRSSSFWEHLVELDAQRSAAGKREVVLRAIDEQLESEDILEMVSSGLLGITVADEPLARFWTQILDGIRVREDLVVHEGGEIAWAVRKGSPLLLAELDGFMREQRLGTLLGNVIFQKYLRSTRVVMNATSAAEMRKFDATVDLFRKYGAQYSFEYLLLLAQGYQESQLDQSVRSSAGAVGVMQVLPSTASGAPIHIEGVHEDVERNIHAGVKYLRHLVDTYLDDPGIDPTNQLLLAFAAYNAGPGNLGKFRRVAEKSGLDPDVWFQNVEYAAARVVGQETVRYVANIYKYYLAYRLALERQEPSQAGAVRSAE